MWIGVALGFALAYATGDALGIALSMAAHIVFPGEEKAADTLGLLIYLVGGGIVGTVVQKAFRGGEMTSFWTSTLGRWLIGRMAGTAVYVALVTVAWVPAAYVVAYLIAGLVYVAGLDAVVSIARVFAVLIWVTAMVVAWHLRTPVKVFIGKGSRPLRRLYRSLWMGNGGSASFAGIVEEWANRWQPGMIFLGHSLFDRRWPVGIKDDRMLCTMSGTGGGKGDSAIIGNLLRYPGSVFAVDVKGQLAAVTGQARREKGQTVHVIDPMNVLGKGTARVDPVSDLDPAALDYVERLRKMVDAMVMSTGERNRFFDEGARTVIAGGIDLLKRRRSGEFMSPKEVRDMEKNDGE